MGAIRLAVGVEIPNGDFSTKTDGKGATAFYDSTYGPDGWIPNSVWFTDTAAGKAFAYWRPLQRTNDYVDAPSFGDGRSLEIGMTNAISSNVSRAIDSPLSSVGQMFGVEQMLWAGWKYRLRFWFRGFATPSAPTADGDLSVQLMASDDALKTHVTAVGASFTIPRGDYDTTGSPAGWRVRETPLAALSPVWGYYPQYLFLRLIPKSCTGPTVLYGSFAHFTIETLGPVEESGTSNAPLGAQYGYYELSKPPLYRTLAPTQVTSMRKSQRLPGGRRVSWDPSGGAKKRTWKFDQRLLTRTDVEKLYRLWTVNTGYASDSGSRFGAPLPLVLMPMMPDEASPVQQSPVVSDTYPPKAYYVDFKDGPFPVPGYDGGFQSGTTESTQIYKAMLEFEER